MSVRVGRVELAKLERRAGRRSRERKRRRAPASGKWTFRRSALSVLRTAATLPVCAVSATLVSPSWRFALASAVKRSTSAMNALTTSAQSLAQPSKARSPLWAVSRSNGEWARAADACSSGRRCPPSADRRQEGQNPRVCRRRRRARSSRTRDRPDADTRARDARSEGTPRTPSPRSAAVRRAPPRARGTPASAPPPSGRARSSPAGGGSASARAVRAHVQGGPRHCRLSERRASQVNPKPRCFARSATSPCSGTRTRAWASTSSPWLAQRGCRRERAPEPASRTHARLRLRHAPRR